MDRSDTFIRDMIICLTAVFLGVFLPFPTLFIAHAVGHSELVEELVKGAVIVVLIAGLSTWRRQMLWAVLFGFIFGLSETMFYLAQSVSMGLMADFWTRFISTVPLHAVMAALVILPICLFRHRGWGIVGVGLAWCCHLAFNALIGANL